MKKLLLILLMIPTLSFAERYDSQYYKDWIEGECIQQSSSAQSDFIAKKAFKRCEKAAKKCVSVAKQAKPTAIIDKKTSYNACYREETGYIGYNGRYGRSPEFQHTP